MKKNNKIKPLKLSKILKEQFKTFIEYHPPKRVCRNLREVIMAYMNYTKDGFPINMDDIIWDISCLMELLDIAEDETKDWPIL